MATTREYTDYLNDQVDIAPVNSQEELQAAELIERLFVQHELETQVQEFDAPMLSGLTTQIYLALMFVGMLLSGILGTVVSIVGLAITAIAFILLLLAKNGHDVLGSVGPRAQSQNVIGVHRATGPKVVKGNRPIVIVAHYDTPRENFLYGKRLAKWTPLLKRLSWPLAIVVAVLALLQIIPFIPSLARHALWVLGVLLALPLLLLGAAAIYERLAACTTGASDNKASIAAMLGVLDMVRPHDDDAKAWAASHPRGVRRELEDELEYEEEDELDFEDEDLDEEAWEDEPVEDEGAFEEDDEEYLDEDLPEEPANKRYGFVSEYEADEPAEDEFDEDFEPEAEEETYEDDYDEEPVEDEYGLVTPPTVRRGAALLESLQVLPEDCEIVYENLTPREEVLERIAPEEEEEEEGGLGLFLGGIAAGISSGFAVVADWATNLFGAIRDFFVGLVDRIGGRGVPEIERGEVEVVEVPEYQSGDTYDSADDDVDEVEDVYEEGAIEDSSAARGEYVDAAYEDASDATQYYNASDVTQYYQTIPTVVDDVASDGDTHVFRALDDDAREDEAPFDAYVNEIVDGFAGREDQAAAYQPTEEFQAITPEVVVPAIETAEAPRVVPTFEASIVDLPQVEAVPEPAQVFEEPEVAVAPVASEEPVAPTADEDEVLWKPAVLEKEPQVEAVTEPVETLEEPVVAEEPAVLEELPEQVELEEPVALEEQVELEEPVALEEQVELEELPVLDETIDEPVAVEETQLVAEPDVVLWTPSVIEQVEDELEPEADSDLMVEPEPVIEAEPELEQLVEEQDEVWEPEESLPEPEPVVEAAPVAEPELTVDYEPESVVEPEPEAAPSSVYIPTNTYLPDETITMKALSDVGPDDEKWELPPIEVADAEFEVIGKGSRFSPSVPVEVVDVPSMNLSYSIPGLTPTEEFYAQTQPVEPVVEPREEWVAEPAAEYVEEQMEEPALEEEQVAEPAEMVDELVEEPTAEEEPFAELAEEQVEEVVAEPAEKLAEELVVKEESVAEAAEDLAEATPEALATLAEELVDEPVSDVEPAADAAVEPMVFEEPVAEAIDEPAAELVEADDEVTFEETPEEPVVVADEEATDEDTVAEQELVETSEGEPLEEPAPVDELAVEEAEFEEAPELVAEADEVPLSEQSLESEAEFAEEAVIAEPTDVQVPEPEAEPTEEEQTLVSELPADFEPDEEGLFTVPADLEEALDRAEAEAARDAETVQTFVPDFSEPEPYFDGSVVSAAEEELAVDEPEDLEAVDEVEPEEDVIEADAEPAEDLASKLPEVEAEQDKLGGTFVLHQLFETAPKQEMHEVLAAEVPQQSSVLHDMFATLPVIEPAVKAAASETAELPVVDTPVEEELELQPVEETEAFEPETVAEFESEVVDEPATIAEPEVVDEFEPAVEPEAVIEPETEAEVTVEPETEPEVVAEPELAVETEPEMSDEPELIDYQPVLETEPVPAVEVEPELTEETESTFEALTEYEPQTVAEPEPEPEDEFESEYDYEFEYLPLAEYELLPDDDELELTDESEAVVVPEAIVEPEPMVAEPEPVAEYVPEAESEAVAEPEPELADEPESEAVVEDEPAFEAADEAIAEPELDKAPEVELFQPEPETEVTAEAEIEQASEPESVLEAVTEVEPASEEALDEEPEVQLELGFKPAAEDEQESEAEAELVPEAIEPDAETELEPLAEAEPEAEQEEESVIEAEPEEAAEPEVDSASEDEPEELAESEVESVSEAEPAEVAESEPEPLVEAESEETAEPEAESVPESEEADEPEPTPAPAAQPELIRIMPGLTFSREMDVDESALENLDDEGLTTISAEAQADAEDAMPVIPERVPRPRPVDDPNWGRTSFKPAVVSAGRRAMLLDLPDPSVIAADPLAGAREGDTISMPAGIMSDEEMARRFEVLSKVPSPLDDPAMPTTTHHGTSHGTSRGTSEASAPKRDASTSSRYNRGKAIGNRSPKKNSKRKMSFGRKNKKQDQQAESMGEWLGLGEDFDAKKDGRQIGSWDRFDDDGGQGKWKGGATMRAGLRNEGANEPTGETMGLPNFDSLDLQPDDEHGYTYQDDVQEVMDDETMTELREAVLGLGDDDLISHDIWFVGVGSSAYDHAGIKAFLDEHRRNIRGAFLVNLDSIGAGDLTLLTNEGMGDKRRADRRMGRMITNIADALHIDLGHADYSWDETDATPAMQRSVRVGTLMGMSPDGVKAHSHTSNDEPEYLDDQQIADVADIVAELIRRS